MHLLNGTSRTAGLLPAIAAGAVCLAFAGPATAQTVKTVNGTAIDQAVLDLYVQSRTNGPAEQATAEQREALLGELTDIYLLTTQDAVSDIRNDPRVAAQIELQSRGVMAQAIASRFFANTEVTDAEVAEEYAAQTKLAPPLQFKARHILLESQGQAVDVISELDGGSDFDELAQEKSTGPSAANGGDLGWFSADQMVKPFSDAVATLEDGKYTSAPVQTEFGWHVILREDSREAEAPPLESVRDRIVQELQQRKFTAYLDSLREDG